MLLLVVRPLCSTESRRPLLVHHVARLCGIAPRTVRWNARCGRLRGFKEPNTPKIWRFLPQDVEEFNSRRQSWI